MARRTGGAYRVDSKGKAELISQTQPRTEKAKRVRKAVLPEQAPAKATPAAKKTGGKS